MNFQLAAVMLSLGVYAFIENGRLVYDANPMKLMFDSRPAAVFRKKLSRRMDACVLDRPCIGCGHRHKSGVWWVALVNVMFVLLNVFHLAYLGLMFDVMDQEPGLQQQVVRMCLN